VGEHLPLFHPEPVAGKTVMIVAAIGIAINGFTAYLFASGRKDDLNIRGAYLHMSADAAVSAGVVVAGPVILWTGPPGPALEVSEATVQRDLKGNSSLWKNQNPPRASDLNLWQARCFSGWADLPRGRSPFSGALR